MSSTWHCKILHKSFMVVVLRGLSLRNLSMVELDTRWLLMRVYVDSLDTLIVSQKGRYEIIFCPPKNMYYNFMG